MMIATLLSALPLWLLLPTAQAKPTPAPAPAEATGPTKTTTSTDEGLRVTVGLKPFLSDDSTTPTDEGLLRVTVDLNNDGKIEIINYYKQNGENRLLMRKDVDLNSDGRVDMRSSFNEAGQITVEEMDGDFDGRVDVLDEYRDGRRTVTQVDTDFDDDFDLKKYYENGVVRRKERDTNNDGKVDFIEILDERGNVVQTGQDLDGNGKVDQRQD